MLKALKSTWTILIGVLFIVAGQNMQLALLPAHSQVAGFNTVEIGYIMGSFYIGGFLGAKIIPMIIKRVGYTRTFAAVSAIASAVIILYAVFINSYAWFVMRIITGFCSMGIYLVCETWLNSESTNKTRGTIMSVYMFLLYSGAAIGPYIVSFDPQNIVMFSIAAVILSISAVPILLSSSKQPDVEKIKPLSFKKLFNRSPFVIVATFLSGMVVSHLLTQVATFGIEKNFNSTTISFLLVISSVGAILLQYPAGKISDKIDRRKVVLVLSLMGSIFSLLGVISTEGNLLFIVIMGINASIMPIYGIVLSHSNDLLDDNERLGATNTTNTLFFLGSIVGAFLGSFLISQFGANWFFYMTLTIAVLLTIYSLYRIIDHSIDLSEDEKMSFVPMKNTSNAMLNSYIKNEIKENKENN